MTQKEILDQYLSKYEDTDESFQKFQLLDLWEFIGLLADERKSLLEALNKLLEDIDQTGRGECCGCNFEDGFKLAQAVISRTKKEELK